MLLYLPTGFLGLVVSSLIAAFMSTTASHLNWGSSYITNDFYKRFINPQASEKKLVLVGRLSTIMLMAFAALITLALSNALQAFHILLQIGAGTGLIYILRWFWWRINAYTEISGMIISFIVALYFEFVHQHTGLPDLGIPVKLFLGVAITTITWLIVTLLTKPVEKETLYNFYRLTYPGGPGWKKILKMAKSENTPIVASEQEGWDMPSAIICMILGCLAVYSALFSIGFWIYGSYFLSIIVKQSV